MSRAGFTYVLTNPGIPYHCKIGRTVRDVNLRKSELNRSYGTSYSFTVASKHMVADCWAVEALAHKMLAKKRVPNSEMFRCTVKEAQAAIRRAEQITQRTGWHWRLWYRLILPRPAARPKTQAEGRGRHLRQDLLVPTTLAGAVLIMAGINRYQPEIPGWLPQPVQATLLRVENWRLPTLF